MNNTTNSIFTKEEDEQIEAIFKNRDAERKRLEEAKKAELQRRLQLENDQKFREIEFAVADAIKRENPPKIVDNAKQTAPKSLKREPVLCRAAKEIPGIIQNIKENKEKYIATALVLTVLVTFGLEKTKLNRQINELSTDLSNSLSDDNFGEKKGFSKKINLTESPRELIEKLNISSKDHMRLYILSLSLSDNDFNNVLKELGYSNGIKSYLNNLGYKPMESTPVGEQYKLEYNEKLKNIIQKLNEHPELISDYLDSYPELGYIFDDSDTYVTESGNVFVTDQVTGRSH